jgi:hypothetical protein
MDTSIIPDHKIHVIARDGDYFFGLLHSRLHEVWTLATCSWIGKGNDPSYNSSTTFETFPFPYPPGTEPKDVDSPIMAAIVSAAQDLVSLRDKWLNPPQHPEEQNKTYWSHEPDTTDPSEDARTLTKLYNKRPAMARKRSPNARPPSLRRVRVGISSLKGRDHPSSPGA